MRQYNGWQDIQTRQCKEILAELIEAKETQSALLLISNTGLGKTNTVKLFKRKYADHTYVVTVGDSFKIFDVVDAILEELGLDTHFSNRTHAIKQKLRVIAKHLKQLQSSGGLPVIILDEAENLKPAILKMVKELYDAIHDCASIVLIGTEQILDSILNRKQKNRQSVPQLWRRFKAGTRYISPLDKAKDFRPFFELYIPGERSLQELLVKLCENYGELHDYLDPALRLASKKGVALTEELFRLKHKIPTLKVA